jgi:hypothetical protein
MNSPQTVPISHGTTLFYPATVRPATSKGKVPCLSTATHALPKLLVIRLVAPATLQASYYETTVHTTVPRATLRTTRCRPTSTPDTSHLVPGDFWPKPASVGVQLDTRVPRASKASSRTLILPSDTSLCTGQAYSSRMGTRARRVAPMLDFIFEGTHTVHFRLINMSQSPSHYVMYTRTLGSSFVSKEQVLGLGYVRQIQRLLRL